MTEATAKMDTGSCEASIVKLDGTMALICLILNVIPGTCGLGSMLSACLGSEGFNGMALCFGICQLLTCWCLVGWIWSIWHGLQLYKKSKE